MIGEQCTQNFYNLVSRYEVSDSPEIFTTRYILGLHSDFQERLNGFYFTSLE